MFSNTHVGETMQKKEVGKTGEDLAFRFLKKRGYRILLRNYTCKMGEMDIIAQDGDTLAFVEVKTRTSTVFGPPSSPSIPPNRCSSQRWPSIS